MRIQHNITAMNSYRNFTNNNSKLSKNLEKLSSGYAINRAGDDAAGLAISEKMRAQITGIEGATKNSKDGISLIQTAEGALTEVHDMLNRMTTLAEQSANGTYQNELDREQLQKEIQSLKNEIDRIADSTNFNGLKLLDGSLSSKAEGEGVSVTMSDQVSSGDVDAIKGVYTSAAITKAMSGTDLAKGDRLSMTIDFTDSEGNAQSVTKTLELIDDDAEDATAWGVVGDDGKVTGLKTTDVTIANTKARMSAQNAAKVFAKVFSDDATVNSNFKVEDDSGKLKFTAATAGTSGAVLKSVTDAQTIATTGETDSVTTIIQKPTTAPADAQKAYNMAEQASWNPASDKSKLENAIFDVNGEKFLFVKDDSTSQTKTVEGLSDSTKSALEEAGVSLYNVVVIGGDKANMDDIAKMKSAIESATGQTLQQGTYYAKGETSAADGAYGNAVEMTANYWSWVDKSATAATSTTNNVAHSAYKTSDTWLSFAADDNTNKGGLSLQIGDTADSFNKLTVSVGDMHVKALNLDDVDISTQDGAAAALDKIKAAINQVSDTRGTLGALQNRLDHTINNLGVMKENIQNAESTIRDTDVAEEMMTYTKNNILNQSAQAMLAQANQLPQGVLQLLQ